MKKTMTNNKDILFSQWYDSLESTKSQGFAYKAWCAGWEAALKPPKREWVGLTDEECRHFNNRLSGSGVAEDIELLKEATAP